VRVSSPFTAVAAGGIAAGIWEILSRSEDDLRRQAERWLITPAPDGVAAIESAVRQATANISPGRGKFSARTATYPPFWSNEDRLVWNATSGAIHQDRSPLTNTLTRGRNGGEPVATVDAANDPFARWQEMGDQLSKAVDRFVWHPNTASTGEAGYRYEWRELPDLLDRIFGKYTPLGMRLVRLAPRMMALNRFSVSHLTIPNTVLNGSAAERPDGRTPDPLNTDGPLILHSRFCIAVEPPAALLVDDRGRAHNANGACCRWPDGSGLYAIHGVTVASRVVEHPDNLATTEIDRERNAEVRRVMIERFGPGRYLRETRARILDHQEGIGTLYRRDIPNEEPLVMLEV
jgi:hypothetical protein